MFTCKGCTEVARLVGEVEDLRKMMESLKRMVTGQGLEEKRGETGDQEASLEEAEEKEKEKSVGEKTRENSSTDNKDGKLRSSDDSDTRLQEEPGESSWK